MSETKGGPFSLEVVREGGETILRIDCTQVLRVPSIEDEKLYMGKAVELLTENPDATKLIFDQKRDYEYDYAQVRLLKDVAMVYNRILRQSADYGLAVLQSFGAGVDANKAYAELHEAIFNTLKADPVAAYLRFKRAARRERINLEKALTDEEAAASQKYIVLLDRLAESMSKTEIIQKLSPYLAGVKEGDRAIYRRIFSPIIKPDFMFTKLMATYPKGAVEVANYSVGGTDVVVFEQEDDIQYLYHITPPEFKLDESKYELLDAARNILSEHTPTQQEFVNPERMREVFKNIGHDLILELSTHRRLKLSDAELDTLTQILIRYTVGFGLIEILLEDPETQDITVNSPAGNLPIFLVHGQFGECKTNIIPSISDVESWASKLRIMSGRPLDEADPVLDTEINIPGVASARIAVIAPPLNPDGIAYAFRRHRDKPWTLALFIKNRMLNPLAAGLLSFLIDGNRTMLVAGTRSAGKSSLLGSLLVEIMRKYRILTIEDTLELPVAALRNLGYNIQPMKVAGALAKGDSEVPADEGIRTTLRLGDSALIIGEVRSKEARALYEAMRVGALANVVAGTIHGDSPYGVFDRVVNDLDVPRTSFKATDIIVVANPIKSADGLHKWRRITQITEVRKEWEEDPLREHGFVDLMKYNAETDELEPTDALINGDSEILKSIAGQVKDWAGDWDAVWSSIILRSDIKEYLVKRADEEKDDELLEAGFVVQCNDEFHRISDKVKEKTGKLDSKRIAFEWKEWLEQELKRRAARKKTAESLDGV
ncbi:CpaF family protein [Candidatus Woesearchaeota archaeon]|nr:CpaF family protein [Candidatus Woesearchaeota archaeon]